jgi:hypothetical protein
MPDITKCNNEECPKKDTCYRYTSKPDEMQSYSKFKPNDDGQCEYFWENTQYS